MGRFVVAEFDRAISSTAALVLIASLGGCHDGARNKQSSNGNVASSASGTASSVSGTASSVQHTELVGAIEFVANDYPRALALARSTQKPIFADTWATWCHSCMSMKQYVLPAPEIQALRARFVWLSIDSERPENADFLERFPATAIPTLWVIDAKSERPLLKWVGASTAPELATLLDEAASSAHADAGEAEAAASVIRGDQAAAAGLSEDAVAAYRDALARAPSDWKRRPRVLEALSLQLSDLGRNVECVELAIAEMPHLPAGTSRANVVSNALGAATDLPDDAPIKTKVAALIAEGTRIATNADEPILIDDRSGLFLALIAAERDANPAEAKRLARLCAAMLETAAEEARSAEKRAVWDPHRLEAYIELGEVEKAIPMLERSERDFPNDFNPPARLARAYYELRRLEPAQISITRALKLAEGPRKLRFYMLKADILVAKNDRPGAKRAIGEAIAEAAAMRLPPNYRRLQKTLEKRYADLD